MATVYTPAQLDALHDQASHPLGLRCVEGVMLKSDINGDHDDRLYLTLDLSEWIDIPNQYVILARGVAEPSAEYPLGWATVWLRGDAQVRHERRGIAPMTADDFLASRRVEHVVVVREDQREVERRGADAGMLYRAIRRTGFSSMRGPC